jgi:hypothetical protein
MSLCRHYVRELRRSILLGTPDHEKGAGSVRSSQALDNYTYDANTARRPSTEQGPSGRHDREKAEDSEGLSAFLRNKENQPPRSAGSQETSRDDLERPPRPSFMTAETSQALNSNNNSSPQTTVSRADIRASAEKILYTFLLPGAEREIILPQGVLNEITNSIETEGRDDPEVFDAAKDYVFQAMERDAFPGFLRMKALGNIVPPSMMLRLIVGLVSMFSGFWAAFVLIFLDKSRNERAWLVLPFTIGVYLLMTHQYMLDPILALVGLSEYTFMVFSRIQEPFVR